ncbi:hypothetical protein BDD12DRAFT_898417 [Trichophaea hybrida]|nr:hypothetical protein BDD12DRAFT_898417 [Trichophaea hybrida]
MYFTFMKRDGNTIRMLDLNSQAVFYVLEYIYSGNLLFGIPPELGKDEGIMNLPKAYALADLLDISELKKIILERIKDQFDSECEVREFLTELLEYFESSDETYIDFEAALVYIGKKNKKSVEVRVFV